MKPINPALQINYFSLAVDVSLICVCKCELTLTCENIFESLVGKGETSRA